MYVRSENVVDIPVAVSSAELVCVYGDLHGCGCMGKVGD